MARVETISRRSEKILAGAITFIFQITKYGAVYVGRKRDSNNTIQTPTARPVSYRLCENCGRGMLSCRICVASLECCARPIGAQMVSGVFFLYRFDCRRRDGLRRACRVSYDTGTETTPARKTRRTYIIYAIAPYKHLEACHGDCYVLDPEAWNRGKRVVIEVIPARNPPIKRPPKISEPSVRTTETRRVVTWVVGRAFDFWFKEVPVRVSEPVWAGRARELRAAGWSIRRIMTELGMKSSRFLREILDK